MTTDRRNGADEDASDDVLEEAREVLTRATDVLARMTQALDDRRAGERRERARLRLSPGRRVTDEIEDLAALEPDALLGVSQLARYWKPCHHNSVLYWIRTGRLPAMRRGKVYLVRADDALKLERVLYTKPA